MATLLGAAEVTAIVDVTRLVIDLAAKMYKPLRGETSLNDDINFIKDEFEMMGAHLLDASRGRGGQRNSSVARTWVRQARDLNYDVEDCFQELVILMEEPPRSPSTPQARKAVADKIKCLIERMQQSNQRYKLIKDSHAASAAHDTHSKFATMPNSFASKKALVGRETEKSHIIQIITKDDKSRQIIPIWGMGGLGKSALARSIYENQEIGDRFQKYAWINLSHPFNAEGFLRSLILQLQQSDITVKEFIKKMQLKDLIEESYKLLQSMSYFIVLDNVSSIAEWRFLIQQIPEDENASRIIVTTREKSVAEHCSIDNIYKLEPLKDDDALELFKTKVLMETANFDSHPEMVEQAKRILCKCNGLPLAIATVGGLLVTRPKTAPEWVKFNEKFSFELEKNPSLEMIRTVLTSNCEDLPYHLQLCFLYLSIFPEDQNIRRRRLVRRWIAEGYSSGTRNMTAEENGESYFADLVSRSIIQPSESLGGAASINNCQVHNLLQEISISKSAEEMFSFVLHNRSNLHTKDAIRHLSITSCWKRVEDELKSIGDLSHLRSLTVCGEWQSFFISEKMTMLRVLDLEGTSGLRDHHIKNMITKLLHLKYLSLRGCGEIFWLPNALGNLWDLQTLDVRGTNIIILPATIVKLRKLQYLRAGRIPEDEQLSDRTGETDMKDEMQAALNTALRWTKTIVDLGATMVRPELLGNDVNRKDAFNTYCRNVFPGLAWGLDMHGVEVPSGVGNLNSLHTLGVVNFAAGKAILTELGNASQLHKLGVTGVNRENSKQFFSAISKLILLQSLSIRSEGKPGLQDCLDGHSSSPPIDIRSLKLYGNLVTLPTWISRLQNLAKLKLRSTRLGLDAMQVMGKLPHLTILRLLQNSFEGKDLQFHFKPGSFPALVFLQLDGLSDLQSVEFEEGATCMLELLQVKDCANIDNKDGCSGLSFLQSLKEVSLKADHGYDDKFMQQLRTQLARNPSLPALKEI